jgi:hypothetical protein
VLLALAFASRKMGLERFELSTPRLSSVCSNQLSYRPEFFQAARHFIARHLKDRISHGRPHRSFKTKQRVPYGVG